MKSKRKAGMSLNEAKRRIEELERQVYELQARPPIIVYPPLVYYVSEPYTYKPLPTWLPAQTTCQASDGGSYQ